MTEHKCIIGLLHDIDHQKLITLEDLLEHIDERIELYNMYSDEYVPYFEPKVWTLKEYCDHRKSTNLTRFKHCPECGTKINWKGMKNYNELT